MLSNPDTEGCPTTGIPIVIAAWYRQYRDNADVVENVCALFMELSEYNKFLYVIHCTIVECGQAG